MQTFKSNLYFPFPKNSSSSQIIYQQKINNKLKNCTGKKNREELSKFKFFIVCGIEFLKNIKREKVSILPISLKDKKYQPPKEIVTKADQFSKKIKKLLLSFLKRDLQRRIQHTLTIIQIQKTVRCQLDSKSTVMKIKAQKVVKI